MRAQKRVLEIKQGRRGIDRLIRTAKVKMKGGFCVFSNYQTLM